MTEPAEAAYRRFVESVNRTTEAEIDYAALSAYVRARYPIILERLRENETAVLPGADEKGPASFPAGPLSDDPGRQP